MSGFGQLLSLKDASQILKVHPNTLRVWDKQGVLKAIRFGVRGDRNYKLEDIQLFLNQKNSGTDYQNIEELSKSLVFSTFLNQSALKFFPNMDLKTAYQTIVIEALNLTKCIHASLLVFNGNSLQRVYSTSSVINTSVVRAQGRTFYAYSENRLGLTQILSRKDMHPDQYKLGIKSILFLPLSFEKKVIGVLNLLSGETLNFSKKQLEMLSIFGAMANLTISRASNA